MFQNGPASSPKPQVMASSGSSRPAENSVAPAAPSYVQPPASLGALQNNASHTSLPALRPVFGVSLDDLLKRDGSAIPLVVYQCVQAVDLFGLEVEGIYRLSGSSAHVNKLKGIFDNGGLDHALKLSRIDIRQTQVRWTFATRRLFITMSTASLVYSSNSSGNYQTRC